MENKRYFFVSYSRSDQEIVNSIIEKLNAHGIKFWIDTEQLLPGHCWEMQIENALTNAVGMLIFVSSASMESKFVIKELKVLIDSTDSLIIPIILEPISPLPDEINERQWIDLSQSHEEYEIDIAVEKILSSINYNELHAPDRTTVSESKIRKVAASIASEKRDTTVKKVDIDETYYSVFIVHGHDKKFLDDVDSFIQSLNIKSVILSRVGSKEQSLLQKFLKWSLNTRFAIVLLSADDFGASLIQYNSEGVKDRALQFRTRQNVILELGFFYGFLGWENVFLLYKKPEDVFPNFELPSDLAGVEYYHTDEDKDWKNQLKERLQEAGFKIYQENFS